MDNSENVTVLTELNRTARARQLSDSLGLLSELLSAWLNEVREPILLDLQNLASGAHDRETQTGYLHLRQDILDCWPEYIHSFGEKLRQPLASAAPNPAEQTTTLQLMEEHELADHIVIREFAARLAESCSNEVFALERRAALMLGQEEDTISGDENPLGPPHLCGALSAAGEALASIRGKPALRPILLRRLEQYLHTSLPDIYHQVNDLLVKRGVLPEIKRSIQRKPFVPRIHEKSAAVQAKEASVSNDVLAAIQQLAAARTPAGDAPLAPITTQAAPPALQDAAFLSTLEAVQQVDWANLPTDAPPGSNLVWQVRHSEAAEQIGHIEAATIDIVAMLFDFIFEDEALPTGVKALVGRLQIPVLKVALLDRSFFSNRDHPARYFLDDISEISIRWGGEALTDDPFYCKLEELVTRIQQEFADDVEIFSRAIEELAAFVNGREEEAQPGLQAVAETVSRREDEIAAAALAQAAARAKAEAAVRPWLDAPIYPPIRDFYETHWVRVLEKIALDPESSDEVWAENIDFMENLAWSISLKSRQQRTKLVTLLPRLLTLINQGLDRIDVAVAYRQPFLDMLYEMHTANVKAAMSAGPLPEPEARYIPTPDNLSDSHGELVVTRFVDLGVEVEEITLVGKLSTVQKEDLQAKAQVESLLRGDWIEFMPGTDEAYRATLKWISPQKGLLLFVRHRGGAPISISPEALASELRYGRAALIQSESLFERALNYVMQLLKPSPKDGK